MLLGKKKQFYSNLNTNILTENRTFWKSAKSFLKDKTNETSRITLIEEERVIFQDHLIARTFNEYFINILIKNLPENQEYESFDLSEGNHIVKKYQNHPSIKLIKTKNKPKTFRFRETNTDEIKNFIEKLDPKKSFPKI